jgi:hypothetical protein
LLFAVYSLEYVALIANNLVLWLFAMKYWVVAKKVEMFQAEINFESKTLTFNRMLFGGAVFFTIEMTGSAVPEFYVLFKAGP